MRAGPAEVIARAHEERVFSGAAWAYGGAEGVLRHGSAGTLAWGGPPVDAGTLWDLASVTKPIAGLAVMALVECGELPSTTRPARTCRHSPGPQGRPHGVRAAHAHLRAARPGADVEAVPTREELLAAFRGCRCVSGPARRRVQLGRASSCSA